MLFNSIHFLFFLPVVFFLYWILPQRLRWILLLIASYYFYMSWRPEFGLLLFATTIIDWFTALKISETQDIKKRKQWLWVSLITNIGCLIGFKYFAFFVNTFFYASNTLSSTNYSVFESFIVPVGLSFYTFQSLSYTIDVYRSETLAEKNPARFALYVSFFPQLVAGPVERFSHLMPQFYEKHKLNIQNIVNGVRIATWGFFKKIVIADRLATFVDPVFADVHSFSGATLLVTGFFFVVQVYCDFSGYSDIATGVARLFGFNLMLNWNRPLLSTSLREFWKRNHISMTTWFRDYVYWPLGGNKKAFSRILLNIFLVFIISGLWHGSKWTFVIWGALHGIFYCIEMLISKRFVFSKKLFLYGWIYLILFHTISLIAFRANNMEDLVIIYSKIFSSDFTFAGVFKELRSINHLFSLVLALCLIAFLFINELHEECGKLYKIPFYNNILRPVFYVVLFVMIFVLGEFRENEFIYYHF